MNRNKETDRKAEALILVVSFGTTAAESRRLNIGAVEQAISEAAGDSYTVRRCFTSQMIINIIKKREGISIDNIEEALGRAAADGFRRLVVQPTHLMRGNEYSKIRAALEDHGADFDSVAFGEPLLSSDDDLSRVADALAAASAGFDDGETAMVFMGHGTDAASNGVYRKMQRAFDDKGFSSYFVGTVEAEPSLDDVIEAVKSGFFKRVVLRPLMLVAGDHALNDMASPDDPHSWYSRFRAAGFEALCVLEGLGQLPAVRDLYADHVRRAIAASD